MGMYTEFYFRASVKDGPVADWLDRQINGEQWFEEPFDNHTFFDSDRWALVFMAGGAVYQHSRRATFTRATASYERNWLVLSSSLKSYGDEIGQSIAWIDPHLKMCDGDLLGYSLYEDSTDDGDDWRDHPTLYFHNRTEVVA